MATIDNDIIRITYSVSQSIEENTSNITVSKVEVKGAGGYNDYAAIVKGDIWITSGSSEYLRIGLSYNQHWADFIAGEWHSISGITSTKSSAVIHDSTGKKTIAFHADLTVSKGSWSRGLNLDMDATLATIPRVSTITATGVELGQNMTISISRASSSFKDTIRYSVGSASGAIVSKTSSKSVSWKVPEVLAKQATTSTSCSIKLEVETFSGSTSVGTKSITVKCSIPSVFRQRINTISFAEKNSAVTVGGYVQSVSQLGVTVSTNGSGSEGENGAYGATVKQLQVTIGSNTSVAASLSTVTMSLPTAGTLPVTVIITDSRGRTNTKTASVTVVPYSPPVITMTEAFRVDADHHGDVVGQNAAVRFTANVAPINIGGEDQNSAEYRFYYRIKGTTAYTDEVITSTTSLKPTPDAIHYHDNLPTNKDYQCYLSVKDKYKTVTTPVFIIPAAQVLMDFDKETHSIGIGIPADGSGGVSIGAVVRMNSHRIRELSPPADDYDAVTLGFMKAHKVATISDATFPAKDYSFSSLGDGTLGNYAFAIVVFDQANAAIIPTSGGNCRVFHVLNVSSASSYMQIATRMISISGTTLSIGDCNRKATNSNSPQTSSNNNYILPRQVWGFGRK